MSNNKKIRKPRFKSKTWQIYTLEFLSVFVAVISAFALNNWNDNRRDRTAETKILTEISNGLVQDIKDIDLNIRGHHQGVQACSFWREVLNQSNPNTDSVRYHYLNLTRDFISIQNTSGYETLKSRGFELIADDHLRKKIIDLYEHDYQILRKIEEEFHAFQFQENFFSTFNQVVAPHLVYNESGEIAGLETPIGTKKSTKKILLSQIWNIELNRKWGLAYYGTVKENIHSLQQEIKEELLERE